ncbi:MAG: hypothetical protein BBJ57_07410 [Desulfobacterales bacterium PC51MH44]|nr:MAG: hypothetical protein BBJ57_07410 [Desulfobacterales bacterium PC51MH44]
MKKLFILGTLVISLLAVAVLALADEWHTTNQVAIRWDPVTTLVNGDPVPATDIVTYSLYTKSVQTGAETEVVTQISETETPITFAAEGDFHIGIRAYRSIPAAGELPVRIIGQSTIGWSSDPLIVRDGMTFGVSHYLQLGPMQNLELPPL